MSAQPEERSKSILLDKFEIYATLNKFQFVETQRHYFCSDARLIDITTFQQKILKELLIIIYDDVTCAELCKEAQKHLESKKPILFARIEKVSNKRERHEITCNEGRLFLEKRQFIFNKLFARAELKKFVPERLIIEY